MNKYWDKTEQERATLTDGQVRAYLDVELMEKGVVKVEPPVLREVPKVKLETTTYYEVKYAGKYSPDTCAFVFATPEQAREFINAQPLKNDSDWELGDRQYASPCLEMTVGAIELPSEQGVLNSKSLLSEIKEAKEANTTTSSEYNTAQKAVEEATSGVWENWHLCQARQRECEDVRKTYEEYLTLCGDVTQTAVAFLEKAYSLDRIQAAADWLGDHRLTFPRSL